MDEAGGSSNDAACGVGAGTTGTGATIGSCQTDCTGTDGARIGVGGTTGGGWTTTGATGAGGSGGNARVALAAGFASSVSHEGDAGGEAAGGSTGATALTSGADGGLGAVTSGGAILCSIVGISVTDGFAG